ncbi:ABC transporter permease [Fontibacillus sp. BL9]|uniref:ABC transporter permease n=1 Tax=Fontibacillus sp. BL9 TaxID=3389971 RepID=UPI00397A158F
MNKWLRQFRFEWSMIFRNLWLLALPLAFAVMNVWTIGSVAPEANLLNEAYTFHAFVHTMTLGLVMLVGILSVRRDIRRSSYEWSSALPVPYATKVSAKYLAALIYFSIFTLVAAAVFAWFSAQRGITPEITVEYALYFAVTYEISYMVTLALAMLLAIAIPNRIVYLIGFCAWMFGTFFMDIFLIDKARLYPLQTFHLSRMFLVTNQPNDTWGFRLLGDELLYSRLFVLSFVLLLLVAGVTVLNLIRPTKHKLAVWSVSAFAVLLAALAFVPYGQIWQQRYEGYYAKLADPTLKSLDESPEWNSSDLFKITEYDLNVVREANDSLRVTAKLTIPGDDLKVKGNRELNLTLNRNFKVQTIKIGEDAASFSRKGDQLDIELPASIPEGLIEVEITYAGTMMDYAPGFQGQGSLYAFVKGDDLFLPGYIAWYPLAGHQPIYVKEMDGSGIQLGAAFIPHAPYSTTFKLSLTGFDRPLYTSLTETGREHGKQAFEGQVSEGLSLFGGDFLELESGDFPGKAVTTPYNAKLGEDILAQWKKMYAYFSGWIHPFESRLDQLLFLPNENYVKYSVENETYVMTYLFDKDYASKMLMNQMLLGSRKGDYLIENMSEDVRLQIRGLMWYLYTREEEGFSDEEIWQGSGNGYLIQELYARDEGTDPDRVGLQMVKQVAQALDEGKYKQVKEVLNYFYAKGLEVPDPNVEPSIADNKIPFTEWEKEWKRVMGDENGN